MWLIASINKLSTMHTILLESTLQHNCCYGTSLLSFYSATRLKIYESAEYTNTLWPLGINQAGL
jgi:hypothetical protein